MINCNECSEMISEDARRCPKCGSKQFEGFTLPNILLSIFNGFIVWFAIIIVGTFINRSFTDNYGTLIDLTGLVIVLLSLYKRYNKRIFTGVISK